jgi:hypothetical protein
MPGLIRLEQQMDVRGDSDQGCLNRIFGIMLVARYGYGESDQPHRRKIVQSRQSWRAALRDSLSAHTYFIGHGVGDCHG